MIPFSKKRKKKLDGGNGKCQQAKNKFIMEEGASSSPKKNGKKINRNFSFHLEKGVFSFFFSLSPTPNFPKLSSLLSPPEEEKGKKSRVSSSTHRLSKHTGRPKKKEKKRIIPRCPRGNVGVFRHPPHHQSPPPPKKNFPKGERERKPNLTVWAAYAMHIRARMKGKREKLGKLEAVQRIHFPTHF